MTTPQVRVYDKTLYEKLMRLRYTNEVVMQGNKKQIERIVSKLNSKNTNIQMEHSGPYVILRKPSNTRYNVYLRS